MINKKFSQSLHDEFDEAGRDMSKQFFKRYGVSLVDNPDKYGVDLIAYREEKKVGYVEVEVRTVWQGDKFNYNTLNIPCRKRKLLELDLPVVLLSWSSHGDYGYLCNASVILNSKTVIKQTEYFFAVPLDKIKLVEL